MFEKIVSDFLDLKKKNPEQYEFEIRFGLFTSKKFDTNISISNFYKLKKNLKLQNNNSNNEKTISIDEMYKVKTQSGSNYDTIRKTTLKNKEGNNIYYFTTKKVIKYYNEYDHDIRFSVASEIIRKDIKVNENDKFMIREKERDTYYFKCGKIDLTKVVEKYTNQDNCVIKFEVEFEINNQQDNSVKDICNIIKYILQNNQDNFHIITRAESDLVLSQYKTLVKSNFFIGAQPETLQKDNLNLFYNELYSVTQKIDGERWFLFISETNDVYFIDTNLKVIKTCLKCDNFNLVLIDGELLRTNGQIHFIGFDLLTYNNKDIRGNNEYNLIKRVDLIKNIVNNIKTDVYYKFSCKRYIWKNVFIGSEILLNENNNGCYDGLIFTPIYESYPTVKKWNKLLKWKSKEQNTIDLYSVKINETEWELYVQTVDDKKKMVTVLFDVNALGSNFNIKTELTTFKTNFDDSYIDPTTCEQFKTNTVIEYKWDYNMKKFIPIKTRWDKTINPFKQGNFCSVACSIWNNITNPIEIDILFKLKNLNNKDDIYFKNMRKFHNKIKESLYNKYTNNSNSLLELCVGKGGDMHKWIYNKIKYVCGYDVSDKNLTECNERFKRLNNNVTKGDFYKLNLHNSNCHQIIKKHYQEKNQNNDVLYDNVSCHFAIHYFFESQEIFDNLISILESNLKEDGYFMITYMDAKYVNKLFDSKTKSNFIYEEHNGNIVYFMKKSKLNSKNNYFGNKLQIFLDGNNILNETSDEYFVNSEYIIKYMKEKGYECVENEPFYKNSQMNNFNLNEYEKTISSLNRYAIFKKQKRSMQSNEQIHVNNSIQKHIELYQYNDKESKYIEFDDLNLFKITCINDVINVINCQYYTIPTIEESDSDTEFNIEKIINILSDKYDVKIQIIDENINKTENLENTLYIYYYNYNVTENEQTIELYNWYIVLYKHKIFYNPDVNTFSKLVNVKNLFKKMQTENILKDVQEVSTEVVNNENTNITEIINETNEPLPIEKHMELLAIDEEVKNNDKLIVEQTENESESSCSVSSSKKRINKKSNVQQELSEKTKQDILNILNSKNTIQILKDCIVKLNTDYNMNIKLSGNKNDLIKRLEEMIK